MRSFKLLIEGEGLHYEAEISLNEAISIIKLVESRQPTREEQDVEEGLKKLWRNATPRQKAYLRVLALRGDWVPAEEVLEAIRRATQQEDLKPRAIAGIRSGLTRTARKFLNEEIDEQQWDHKRGQNLYRIKPRFLEPLRRVIEEAERS